MARAFLGFPTSAQYGALCEAPSYACTSEPLAKVLDDGTALLELLRGRDAAEGIAAFLAKRPPRWS